MINFLICDDSNEYLEIIKNKIEICMNTKIQMDYDIKTVDNIYDLKKCIDKGCVDILFLDIMLNNENSLDWSIENINNKYMQIIFMTSYPQTAYNLSESDFCYYLVKSKIDDDNLFRAIKRALQNTTKKDPNLKIIKIGNKNIVINYQDIMYIETQKNSVLIHMESRTDIISYSSLRQYEESLPPNFLRCHKSFVVNMNYITSFQPSKFFLGDGRNVPIPPKKYKEVTEQYKNYLNRI